MFLSLMATSSVRPPSYQPEPGTAFLEIEPIKHSFQAAGFEPGHRLREGGGAFSKDLTPRSRVFNDILCAFRDRIASFPVMAGATQENDWGESRKEDGPRRAIVILAGIGSALFVFVLYLRTLAPSVLSLDRSETPDSAMLQMRRSVGSSATIGCPE